MAKYMLAVSGSAILMIAVFMATNNGYIAGFVGCGIMLLCGFVDACTRYRC